MLLFFLGTGAGRPSLKRNVSSIALQLPEPTWEVWLFDCGEGTQQQLLRSPFSLQKVTRIFITHLHGDHIFGLPGLLGSRSFTAGDRQLTIHGPPGIKEFLATSIRISGTHLGYPLVVHEIKDCDPLKINGWTVKVNLLEHGLPCFGYRIEEPERLGKLNVSKLQKLQVPAGPIYGLLKRGKAVTLENGQVLDGRDFVSPARPGRHVAILGDTRYCRAAIELAENADILVHEATFGAALTEKAFKYHHSTTTQAAQVAKAANVNKLVLTHLSSRYRLDDYEELLAEARSIFLETYLAKDLCSLEIPRSQAEGALT